MVVELQNIEKCRDYKVDIETVWKDVSLPSGQFSSDNVVSSPLKLTDAAGCRSVSPRVKSSSLKLTPVSSASACGDSIILLLISSFTIFKVFRI